MLHNHKFSKALIGITAAVGLLLLAGCAATGDTPDTSAPTGEVDSKRAEADLASWRAGVFESPPTTAPTPEAGKNVWIVTYGLASTPGAAFDRGAREAAEVMGWKTTSCDGNFSPSKWQECYRQAIAAGADGLAIYVNDCASTQAALEEARAAGVIVVSAEAADCSDQQEGGPSLFDSQVAFAQGTFADWLGELLKPAAAYVTTELGADARIILMDETGNFAVGIMTEEVKKYLAEICPSCEVVATVDYRGDEFGGPLQAKVGQALLQHPDANVIIAPYDDATLNAVAAVRESGRDVLVTAGPGSEATFDMIRSGEVAGAYAQELGWEGWAVMDSLNRIFNGEDPVSSGQGIAWVDSTNIGASSEGFVSPIDYRAIYTKAFSGEPAN